MFNIHHRVDRKDPVPGKMTYQKGKVAKHLGYGLLVTHLPIKANVVVLDTKVDSENEELSKHPHLRIYAKMQKGADADFIKEKMAVHTYDNSHKEEFAPFKFLRKSIFCALSEKIWRISRFFYGRIMDYASDKEGIIYARFHPEKPSGTTATS